MLKVKGSLVHLALCTAGLIGLGGGASAAATDAAAPTGGGAAPAAARAGVDLTILHVQVILDRLGFSPGVIDGKPGRSLVLALTGFQTSGGIEPTGRIDRPTLAALSRYRSIRPVRVLAVAEEDVRGPFVGALPDDPAQQAKLATLGYANPLELLAEKFHTTPATLIGLNDPAAKVQAGAQLRLPNVLPASRAYPDTLKPEWRQTLSNLNVNADQPKAARVVVDKSEAALKVYDAADKLVAQFPATMGSEHDPLPIGKWTIKGASYNPPFHYNPALFWDAGSKDKKQLLPPGPNGPVGVIWLDLSKEHYGIHGTPRPETIGRSESHGCIRLTNWDAARLSLMVKLGTPAVFQN